VSRYDRAMPSGLETSARVLWRRLRASAGELAAARGWSVAPGTEPVPIRMLASPLRFDLEVRREFLRLCALHAERGGEPDESLSSIARSTPYWLWWTEVYCPRNAPELAADPLARGRAFSERVRASFELCRSFAKIGFDRRRPIVLRRAERLLPTDTGKAVTARYIAGDGCHRLALLWLAGQKELEPGQYVVRSKRELRPLDNTWPLREVFRDDPGVYLRFIASGYAEREFGDVRELAEFVRARAPERLDELRSVLRADAILHLE